MASPRLLFLTNPENGDPEEDRFLSNLLGRTYDVSVARPETVCAQVKEYQRLLIRNAWPSRLFKQEFNHLHELVQTGKLKTYNPFHRNVFIEDKTYLGNLFQRGFPVVPTVLSVDEIGRLGPIEQFIIKPLDGCSSFGVERLMRQDLASRDLKQYVIQPFVELIDEISFYVIDDRFEYATVSAGPGKRWELTEYVPTLHEIEWAQRFVDWNRLPYGLQRIDACRLSDGRLLLMEVEDLMPFLSLEALSPSTRDRVCTRLTASLDAHLR